MPIVGRAPAPAGGIKQRGARVLLLTLAGLSAVLLGGCGASLNADAPGGLTGADVAAIAPTGTTTAATGTEVKASASAPVVSGKSTAKAADVAVATGKKSGAAATGGAAKVVEKMTASATPGSAGYKIGPQDVLEISVFKAPELSKSVQVADSGSINLPLVNEVQAAGKTSQEVERELTSKLGAKYLQNPQVTVFVKEFNSQRVTMEGALKKPGVYPLRGHATLLHYVAVAEGLNELSDKTLVVFRTVDGKRSASTFDVSDLRSGATPDPVIQSGDVIIAPTSAMKETLSTIMKAAPLASFVPLL